MGTATFFSSLDLKPDLKLLKKVTVPIFCSECRAWIRRKNDIQLLSFPVAGIIIIRMEQKDFLVSL